MQGRILFHKEGDNENFLKFLETNEIYNLCPSDKVIGEVRVAGNERIWIDVIKKCS